MEEIMGPQMYWGGWTKEGGVKTLSPSPPPRISPNRQYAPYFVTKANLCTYTGLTLKYIANGSKNITESHVLGWADGTQTQYFRNVREKLIKADERN
jgi:hypothetical protein